MGKFLYFDCASGISGDMTVAALLDLVGDNIGLEKMLSSLKLTGVHWHITRTKSYGISAMDFDVHLEEEDHEHHHDGEHHHHHEKEHHHIHRNIHDIEEIIAKAKMGEKAKSVAKKIFNIVAEAESKVHGLPIDEVHFHEVGALDSIIDILSVAYLIDTLGIENCTFSPLSEGRGTVMCQHGELSVPVPAVVEIASKYQLQLNFTNNNGEMVTPTGIAIVAALKNAELPANCNILKNGTGAGKRDFGKANVLRVMLLEESQRVHEIKNTENKLQDNQVWLIESSIDDATGECLGIAMEEIFKAGALDVQYLPCYMKKNRPAWILRVIVKDSNLEEVEETIFRTTTTIGFCKRIVERSCMERKSVEVQLPFGKVTVKECHWNGMVKKYPEFESVKKLAEETGVPFLEIFEAAKKGE